VEGAAVGAEVVGSVEDVGSSFLASSDQLGRWDGKMPALRVFFTSSLLGRRTPILELTIQEETVSLAQGQADYWRMEALARTGGAGGRNWTERLPLRFGWLAQAA